ncbi:MAG: hypothetical protein DIU52_008185 [bacterium]|jgi:hypothetical protein|nr:MAG: hypothetical protein DIU52_12970 [bacterium]
MASTPQRDRDPGERLHELRRALVRLHKALVDFERIEYERVHGRLTSSELLQILIHDPWFAWLHPLSELVVRIDEFLDEEQPPAEGDLRALVHQVRSLLTPTEEQPEQGGSPFGSRYFEALQGSPAVVLAHAEVQKLL